MHTQLTHRVFRVTFFFAILLILGNTFSYFDVFSPELVSGSLLQENCAVLDPQAEKALSQPYSYLGKGRQVFAFASADGQWVIKFFNQKYFRVPFYMAWCKKEQEKRAKRKRFYLESYRIAALKFQRETGICYLHLGRASESLPVLALTDKKNNSHTIDLNQVPFVLQKRGKPFYPSIPMYGVEQTIQQFLSLIAVRIEHKIADDDHEVECNFGFCEDRVIHLDPGRFYFEAGLWEPERLRKEWWSSTHRFRKWLEIHYPESLSFFDRELYTRSESKIGRSAGLKAADKSTVKKWG